MGRVECRGRRVLFKSQVEELPNGARVRVDRVIFPNSVTVLPLRTSECRILLIRQYRPAVGEWLLEAPAGVLEEGEDPGEAAAREMEEEAGLRPRELLQVASGYVSPGYSTEYMHLYIGLSPVEAMARPEEHEVITDRIWLSVDDAVEMIRRGELRDVKTILLVYAVRDLCTGAQR